MNRGFNAQLEREHQKPTDYEFGDSSPKCIALIPNDERGEFLPKGEVQKGREDFQDCASRAPVNVLETKFNYLYAKNLLPLTHNHWLIDNGYVDESGKIEFSDRFIAVNSGTTRNGNSLIAPLHAIHKQGLIPKHRLPANPSMTWAEYHDPSAITPELVHLGLEFLERFSITYERVKERDFPKLLDQDMLDVAGFAWPTPVNGEYPRTGADMNHAFVVYRKPQFFAFDNYEEAPDDFVKKLAPNYDLLNYGYRMAIAVIPQSVGGAKRSFLDLLKAWLREVFA